MKRENVTDNLTNETAATQKRIENVPLRATTNNHNTMKRMKVLLLVLLAAVSPLLLQAQTTESFTYSTNRLVPDGSFSGLSDVRSINTTVGNISSLKVRLKMTGEFNGDMYAYLRHTNGFVVLLNRVGKTASNAFGYGDSGFDVTFQAGAANGDIHAYQNVTTPAAGFPLTGIWQPDGRTNDPVTVTDASTRATSLTNFNGLNGAGEWTLYLADVESGATNMLIQWSLDISGAASPTLTWTNPADITYGTPLSGTQLNATATYNATNVPGTLTYSSPAGTYLNAGNNQTLSVTFTPADTNSFLPVTTSVAVNVTPAPLTITANSTNKVYGAALPTFTASYSGFVNGDTAASLGTPVTLGTSATAASPIGVYPITASGAVGTNYSISYVAGTLTVTTAPLTITANSTNKVYGAALPTFTASYSGFVNGDDASSLGTAVTLGTTASASSPVGTYPITASGAVGTNYSISYVAGTLAVTTAPLTITANSTNKVYGAALPTFTASYSGFVNGDDASSLGTPVTLGTSATAASPIGVYPITASGAVSTNYSISYVAGTLTVTTAPLTITANSTNKVYGAALPVFTASYSGFVNGDDASNLGTPVTLGTTASAASPIGDYPITASGAVGTNYSISYVAGTLTVTTAPLTITANSTNKVYGAALPTFTASYSGFVNGDTAASLDTAVTLGTTASASSSVGTYPITASGAVGTNYSISYVAGTLTVTTAPLTITANSTNKVYGAALPAFTASYSGFVNGDTAASLGTPVTLGTSATAASPIGVYPITASGAVGTNYSISYVAGTLTVTTAPLTITANSTNKVYGAALPVFTASYSGFVNGDTAASLGTPVTLGTTASASSPVGIYPITASGAVGTNYSISYMAGTLTVTTAPLTITANSTNKVYGAALPVFTASYSGFVNGDTAASLGTPVTLGTTASASSPVGTYPITASSAVGTNYFITHVNGTLTVTPGVITITADDKSKAFGQALPVFTATYSGFVLSQGTNDLTGLASVTTTATATSNVGAYPITASGATSTNYTFSYVGGTLTITQSLSSGAVVSSANPAVPGTNVTFSMTVNAVAPGAGTPTGTVNFRIDGGILGAGTLFGGVATFTTNNLALGSHTVVAEYAGNLNFVGTTNALAQAQVINTPPVAGKVTIERSPTTSVKVRLSTLLASCSDADGDTLTPTVSSTSASNATVTVSGGWVFYTPPAGFTNADSFTYTITDGRGGSAVGTVTVAIHVDNSPSQNLTITDLDNGSYRISGNGISGYTYRLQYSDTAAPFNWVNMFGGSVTADSTGKFEYIDTTGGSSRFYRTVYP
jgi:hypothetical protein